MIMGVVVTVLPRQSFNCVRREPEERKTKQVKHLSPVWSVGLLAYLWIMVHLASFNFSLSRIEMQVLTLQCLRSQH